MNYTFGTGLTDLSSGRVVVDFSRDPLPTLNEAQLNESVPLDTSSTLQTCWAPGGGSTLCRPVNQPLNWNGNMTATTPQMDVIDPGTVASDITAWPVRDCGQDWTDDNGDGQVQSGELDAVSTPGDTLTGSDDWENIMFRGPLNETAAAVGAASEPLEEPTEEVLERAEATVQALLRCSPPTSGEWGIGANCTIWSDVVAPAGLRVAQGAHLRIAPGVHLDIDLTAHALRVDGGGRLTLEPTARID